MPVIIPDLPTALQSSSNALETKPQVISPVVDPEVPQPDLSVFQPLLYQPSTGLSYQGSGTVISSTNGIKIYDEGNLVLSKAIALNFIGDAVEVTANGSTAYITISGTGGSSYGNSNVSNFLAHYGSNTISTTGNVTVNGLFANTIQNLNGLTVNNGDSSHGQTSGLTVVSNGDGNATSLFNTYGNIVLQSSGNGASPYSYTFDYTGNVSLPGNLSAVGSVRAGAILTNALQIQAAGNIWEFLDNRLTVPTGGGWQSNKSTGDDYILSNIGGFIHFQSLFANANIASELHLEHGQAHIIVNDGTSQEWIFETTGNLNLPSEGNIVGVTANNSGHIQWIGNSSGDGAGYTTLGLIPDDTLVGNDQYLIIDPTAPGHIHIRAGGTQDASSADLFLGGENSYFKVNAGANNEVRISANSHAWVFGADSVLTVPGEGIIKSIDDTVVLQSVSTANAGNTYSARLGTNGGLYLESTEYANGWLYLTNDSGNANIYSPSGNINVNSELSVFGNITAYGLLVNTVTGITANAGNVDINQITGLGGYLNATGGVFSGTVSVTGNITAGNFIGGGSNVELVAGSYTATFDTTGNLTVPTNINASGLLIDTVTGVTANAGNININQITGLGGYLNATGVSITGNITGNTSGFAIGYRDIPQVSFSANATAALTDAGKHYYSTTAGNLALTIPDNSNVALPTGATLTVVVNAAGNVLVNQGTGVSLYMAGSSTTGNRVVGAYGLASVMKVAANTWVISGTGVY